MVPRWISFSARFFALLDHCVLSLGSITAFQLYRPVPRWISWFFALLARSLRFNTMRLDHCGGSSLVQINSSPLDLSLRFRNLCLFFCWFIALWFTALGTFLAPCSLVFLFSALWFFSPCWLDHCVSTPCDSITAAVPHWFSRFFALLARSLRFNTM